MTRTPVALAAAVSLIAAAPAAQAAKNPKKPRAGFVQTKLHKSCGVYFLYTC